MVTNKKELKEYIKTETSFFKWNILRYVPVNLFEAQIIAKYLVLLRKTEFHVNCGHRVRKIIYMMKLKRMQCRYSVHIPINVFGKGLSIAHLGTIVVNGFSSVGDNCRIHVGVVIGSNGLNYRGGYQR